MHLQVVNDVSFQLIHGGLVPTRPQPALQTQQCTPLTADVDPGSNHMHICKQVTWCCSAECFTPQSGSPDCHVHCTECMVIYGHTLTYQLQTSHNWLVWMKH